MAIDIFENDNGSVLTFIVVININGRTEEIKVFPTEKKAFNFIKKQKQQGKDFIKMIEDDMSYDTYQSKYKKSPLNIEWTEERLFLK